MTAYAIHAENLTKLYRIGLRERRYVTLMGTIFDAVRSPFKNFRKLRALANVRMQNAQDPDVIFALRNVSLQVCEGEVLGIIGANGAGKSTLLRVLAGITEPTSGRALIRGRVSCLLQVGTGFHPELTGRENIYLNGTLLGMTRAEVNTNFDEIVAFSGIERFIETPVKRYSSGMKVRLGFAVAAHLRPEILLIDEVLAVGDIAFQRKCLGKMGEVARSGRTVLFVSHNMAAVEGLCQSTIVLKNGSIVFHGSSREAIQLYVSKNAVLSSRIDLAAHSGRMSGVERHILTSLDLASAQGVPTAVFPMGSDIIFSVSVACFERAIGVHMGIGINSLMGQRLCTLDSEVQSPLELALDGTMTITCRWMDCMLLPGEYSITVWIKRSGDLVDAIEHAGKFSITAADVHNTGRLQALPGIFEPKASWHAEPRPAARGK